ncbi:hypothetical protein L1787_16655 [Acuticoccus sp. M5D2P5]|nr:hypothetical protein [Acuticoccus kalidii]MCF3935036.1 hypothetical protein [Acuticoccus kalidii]
MKEWRRQIYGRGGATPVLVIERRKRRLNKSKREPNAARERKTGRLKLAA